MFHSKGICGMCAPPPPIAIIFSFGPRAVCFQSRALLVAAGSQGDHIPVLPRLLFSARWHGATT